jgi:hypothetical protein
MFRKETATPSRWFGIYADRLYNVIDLKRRAGEHVLLLKTDTPGIEAVAFTFG